MMEIHDILRNIEQMLVPFKCFIEASEGGMAQALPIVQTTHAKEPKFIILKKFDGTQSKFCSFVQQINFFFQLHPSHYPDDSMQVAFIAHRYQGMLFFGLYHF